MDNTVKFTRKADIYAKYRPSYPDTLIDYLITANALTAESLVADIGAGTGKLSERLIAHQLHVTAVEPNADMRSTAEAQLNGHPCYRSLNGTAEQTGLPDNSVDLVTVAQAFHWFDLTTFRNECRRILKSDAQQVALIWNTQATDTPASNDIHALYKQLYPDFPFAARDGAERTSPTDLEHFFRNSVYKTKEFPNDRVLTLEEFIGLYLSKSYSPGKTDPSYATFIKALTDLFQKHSQNETLTLPQITRCYLGQV